MIIIYNFITLCKYLINCTIGHNDMYSIEFEYIKKSDQDIDDYEPECQCNLCHTQEKIYFFFTRHLKYLKR